jgi:hypothetical protein
MQISLVRSADIAASGVLTDEVHGGSVGVADFRYEPERTLQFHLGSGSARQQIATCSFAALCCSAVPTVWLIEGCSNERKHAEEAVTQQGSMPGKR